jgi:hypothetical protein
MDDRPEMAKILEAHPDIYDWLVQEFDTTRAGFKPLWSPKVPIVGWPAEHEYPSNNMRPDAVEDGTVIFPVSTDITAWDQLTGLIFLLYNFRGADKFEEIHNAAID